MSNKKGGLLLQLKAGESIVIDKDIVINISKITGQSGNRKVRIYIEAPEENEIEWKNFYGYSMNKPREGD
jgi:sRNA-binding carbon storage regulator CsrA